jgi:hypothetical protein
MAMPFYKSRPARRAGYDAAGVGRDQMATLIRLATEDNVAVRDPQPRTRRRRGAR